MRDLRYWQGTDDEGDELSSISPGKVSMASRIQGQRVPEPDGDDADRRAVAGLLQPIGSMGSIQADGGQLDGDPFAVHLTATSGAAGDAQALPHLGTIQASFGHHDVGGVRAHVGGPAAAAAGALGTRAYATGDDVAFAATPDVRLAAHEAAHVVQQRGGVRLDGGVGQRGDAYERHADAVADRVVRGESAEALLDTMAHRGSSGGPAVQRDELETSPDEMVIVPRHLSETVAVWHGWPWNIDVTTGVTLIGQNAFTREPLGPGVGHFASEAAAIAACQSEWHNAMAGAIFLENGRHVAYWCFGEGLVTQFTWDNVRREEGQPWTAVEFTGACRAIVMRDGVVLRPSMYRADDAVPAEGDPALMPGASDMLPGYRELHGDFTDLTPDEFRYMFSRALKDNALTVLSRSQAEAARIRESYDGDECTPQTDEEWDRMQAALDEVVTIDAELAAAQQALDDAEFEDHMWVADHDIPGGVVDDGRGDTGDDLDAGTSGGATDTDAGTRDGGDTGGGGMDAGRPDVEGARVRLEELQQRRRVALLAYPILGHMDTGELVEFQALPLAEKVAGMNGQLGSILEDIETTRDNIIDGTLDLWTYPSMVNATIAGLGITDPTVRQMALDEAASHTQWDMIWSIGGAVLAVGLGLVATFATGGLALAAAGGALGLGAADAMMQTRDYFAEDAASNTDVNPEETIVPEDLVQHWGWLVVAWVGVGLDALDVIRAVRAVKAAADTGVEIGEAVGRGVDELAAAAPETAARLRAAAGQVDEIISESNRAALAARLGAPVEISEELGAEVRVYYRVDEATKEMVVTAVRCGSAARVVEVLAHERVVRLLTRYNGAVGGMRRVWDRMLSFVGFTAEVCPHPPGSAAFESWFELRKLDEILDARRAALSDALGTADEAHIRRDVEFLEAEQARHTEVVDQMSLETGVGYIARAEEQTREAIRLGMPDIFDHPLIPDPSKFYYRINDGGEPPFILCRISTADAPPRTVVRGESGGWEIAEGALSRNEEAARMVTALGEGPLLDAYHSFEAAFTHAQRVVPLQGVSATGKNLGELIRESGRWDEMQELLIEAFRRGGNADPEAAAAAAMARVDGHSIVVVQGTDQLRAFNYRLNFAGETGAEAVDDLHHIIPLQLGGGHQALGLVDVQADLHRRLHELIESVQFAEGVTLAPHSIRAGGLNFSEGVAALLDDGTVQLARLNPDGTYTLLP